MMPKSKVRVVLGFAMIAVIGCGDDAEPECMYGEQRCDGDWLQACGPQTPRGPNVWYDAEDCAAFGASIELAMTCGTAGRHVLDIACIEVEDGGAPRDAP